jgi:hypothetical protein
MSYKVTTILNRAKELIKVIEEPWPFPSRVERVEVARKKLEELQPALDEYKNLYAEYTKFMESYKEAEEELRHCRESFDRGDEVSYTVEHWEDHERTNTTYNATVIGVDTSNKETLYILVDTDGIKREAPARCLRFR